MTQIIDWGAGTAHRIGRAIRSTREQRNPKLSASELARLVDSLGYEYSRNALVNLEGGRKSSVDVAELLAIAHILNVPVANLLFPCDEVEIAPGVVVGHHEAIRRLSGIDPEPEPGRELRKAEQELAEAKARVEALRKANK